VHGAQPIRILLSMFPFSLFLARGKWKMRREPLPPPSLDAYTHNGICKEKIDYFSEE